MYLAGMPMKDIFKYVRESNIALKKGGTWFVNDTLGVLDNLTAKEMEIFETYIEFTNHGFHDMGNKILEFPEHIRNASKKLRHKANPMRIYDKVTEFTFNLNEKQDTLYRFAAYMWAKDNMDKVLEMGLDTPESFVRFALFDFQDLSVVEQDIYKKLIPFYTFTKKNLGFQMRNMMKNPNRYNRLMKGFDSMWDMLDLEPEELDRYTIENFWIPIPFLGEDGKFYAIKASLPLGDLGEWASDPVRRLMASTSPVIRAPFEIATNTQTFSNMPIESFKGQKGFQIPELPRGAEYALGQFGLDVPVAQMFDLGRTTVQGFKGEISNPIDAISQGLLGTAVSKRDPAATKTRKAYEYLDELENLMRYYKQENIEIPTIAEINNRDKSGRIQAILNNLKRLTKRG
jgi:hypothetical protein